MNRDFHENKMRFYLPYPHIRIVVFSRNGTLPQPLTPLPVPNYPLDQASTPIAAFTKAQKRDLVTIDSLVIITRVAHDDAFPAKAHLTAMMLLATSESARKFICCR